MTNDESPKNFEEHQIFLTQMTSDISKKVWGFLAEQLNEHGAHLDQADVNYIFTGVCAGLFAHFNAILLIDGGESSEHVEKQMLENFNEWYKLALPSMAEQLKRKDKQSD